MLVKYRLLDTVDWPALNGQRVTLEVSPNYIIAVTRDGALIQLAKAMRPGHAKNPSPNGAARPQPQPATAAGEPGMPDEP
jgi:hypothetical protein